MGNSVVAIGCLLLVLGCLLWQVVALVRIFRMDPRSPLTRTGWIAFAAGALVLGFILLRPHEHVFQGLDSSAYRLMAQALRSGRPLNGPDTTLQELPADARKWVLLDSQRQGRLTRDRSFEIESLGTCRTKPFFYPFLPLCMVGLDYVVPGSMDYFAPLVAFLLCCTLVFVAVALAGPIGMPLVLALLLGSPLPAWLFRGCYVETISGIFMALALLSWLVGRNTDRRMSFSHFLALGLAVSFHPVMIVLVIPLLGLIMFDTCRSASGMLLAMAGLLLGAMPIVLFTAFVATPYGGMTTGNVANWILNSSSIRPTLVIGAFLVLIMTAALCFRARMGRFLSVAGWRNHALSANLLVLWIAPALLAMAFWEQAQGKVVRAGFREMFLGLQIPFGVALGLTCIGLLLRRSAVRARLAITAVFLSLPLFCYLKGAESMGLWSQRRLIASLLLVIVCCLPFLADLAGKLTAPGRARLARVIAVVIVLLGVGFHSAVRWPAPYTVRYEAGADKWVERVRGRVGKSLVAVDNYGFSVPLAVDGKSRVIGLSDDGAGGLPLLSSWLAARAQREEVFWLTAYSNPGLEDGVVLQQEGGRERADLMRAHSKTVLPAVYAEKVVDVAFLKIIPTAATNRLLVHKILDGGPLALRGPWRQSLTMIDLQDGTSVPAQWSRQGSGVIGPVSRPGGTVQITLEGTAGRADGEDKQILRFVPPWEGSNAVLTIGKGFTNVTATLRRPDGEAGDGSLTGTYRIYAELPYTPAKVGIRGYQHDLGALLHSIRIEVLSSNSP
ncbi:MAG: hypothetical protein C0404_10715 [Verrucomicrobia bacterium]|nr:hypothetical protein [Verrucomicrobiota bacterium]